MSYGRPNWEWWHVLKHPPGINEILQAMDEPPRSLTPAEVEQETVDRMTDAEKVAWLEEKIAERLGKVLKSTPKIPWVDVDHRRASAPSTEERLIAHARSLGLDCADVSCGTCERCRRYKGL